MSPDRGPWEIATIWVAAVSTLAIYTILYRENRVFRFFEHIFVGLATGWGVVIVWRDVLKKYWWDQLSKGQWWWAAALPIAAMYYMIYTRRYVWLSRLIISTMFGLFAGTVFQGFANEQVPQIYAAFRPLSRNGWPDFNAILAAITLISVVTYFFFSFRHERVPGLPRVARLGRWLMMISFGSIFGATVMARMSLLIARLQFLLYDWLYPLVGRKPPG